MRTTVSIAVLTAALAGGVWAQEKKTAPASADASEAITLNGILIDAGCRDRTALNLARAPISLDQSLSPESLVAIAAGSKNGTAETQTGAITAKGITVDAATLAGEREDVMQTHFADMISRRRDPSCGITAETRGFALLTANGLLLNLNQGGNTYAWQAVQSSDAGRAMINGKGPAVKPRAMLKGKIQADRLIVESLNLM